MIAAAESGARAAPGLRLQLDTRPDAHAARPQLHFGQALVLCLFVSVAITLVALAGYDRFVRQPRTPRVAVVDIAKLYAAAESQARARIVGAAAAPGGAASAAARGALPPELATMRELGNFGPQLESVLRELSGECRCVIAAMATVFGEAEAVPDFTQVAAQRLGVGPLVR